MATKRKRNSNGQFASNSNGRAIDAKRPLTDNEIATVIQMSYNEQTSRSRLARALSGDERRNIDDECGFPKGQISNELYRQYYDRMSIATRVVQVLPKESWKTQPTIFETEDPEEETEFELSLKDLGQKLRGRSWFHDEEGSPIWEHLLRIDILSGIGAYGIILIGVDDGKPLNEPAELSEDNSEKDLLFIRTLDASLLSIADYVEDETDPRLGQPEMYNVDLSATQEAGDDTGIGRPRDQSTVHWTRVVHIADNLGSSEIFAAPRMQPVFNRLYGLRLLYGGSAEMFWKGAFFGLSFETHPQLGGEVDTDPADLKTQIEQYMNGLQRHFALTGMTVNSIAPQVVDPSAHIESQLDAICIQLGIPKRIFTGSERGELASSQDDRTWNNRLRHRQNSYITPRIIVPFIDRLILLGILPIPKDGYSVVWPDLDSLSMLEQAEIAVKKTEALVKYVQGGVENLIDPANYLTRILSFTDEEAVEILDAAMANEEPLTISDEEEVEGKAAEMIKEQQRQDKVFVQEQKRLAGNVEGDN